ncbi:hypothetical protein pb186bvf_019202 [Paramecium bursaria]
MKKNQYILIQQLYIAHQYFPILNILQVLSFQCQIFFSLTQIINVQQLIGFIEVKIKNFKEIIKDLLLYDSSILRQKYNHAKSAPCFVKSKYLFLFLQFRKIIYYNILNYIIAYE